MNRQVLAANQEVLRPISQGMKAVIPGPVQDRLHDLNSNLKEPRIFVNNVLHSAWKRRHIPLPAFREFDRWHRRALRHRKPSGLAAGERRFRPTLFVWGVSEGPYVVRPYLGPGTMRDAVGSTVDMFGNPLGWLIGTQVET
jgi:phospholipid-binding lipoprotein MlaA